MTAIYLSDLAERLDVQENTIRSWCRKARSARNLLDSTGQSDAVLPANFLPERLWPQTEGGRKKLVWQEDQLPGLQSFARESSDRWCGQPKLPEEEDFTVFFPICNDWERFIDVGIDEIGLKVRTVRALEREEVTSIGQLLRLDKKRIREIHNFGQKSIDEVIERAGEHLEKTSA